MRHLPGAHQLTAEHPIPLDELIERIDDVCAWTTWHDLTNVVTAQRGRLAVEDTSVAASIARLTESIVESVSRHS